ncbi:MAG: PAS domain S-box protein [Chloroflexi bacterium]|nr:PAS domain S-box protein [Chloroflexota bacterium]
MTELNEKSRKELEEYVLELEGALSKTISNQESTMDNLMQRSVDLSWFEPSAQHQTVIRILIIDDDPGMRILARKALNDQPFELLEASSGQQALTIIEESTLPIDVVLLDIKMPGMDGFEVIKALKDNPETKRIKIIMISSTTLLGDKIRAFEAGASDYVVKPFAKEELLARITVQAKLIKANEAIRISEQKLHTIFETIRDGIAVVDAQGKILEVNESFVRLFGFNAREEAIGTKASHLVIEEDRARVIDEISKGIETGQNSKYDYTGLDRSGRRFAIETNAALMYDSSGNIKGFVTITRDITNRKKTEESIRESEERYRFLTENVNSMISMADMNGNYIYVNEAHQRILGYSKEELVGNSSAKIIHPDDWDYLTQSFASYIEKGNLFKEPVACRLVTKEGLNKWAEMHGRLIEDEHGIPEYIVVVGTDITERKDVENAMAIKVAELQKSEMATLNIMEDLQESISSLEKVKQELNAKNEELTFAAMEQATLFNSLEEQNQIIGDSQLELAQALDRAVKSEDETKLKNEELIAVQDELREINLHLEERVEERTAEITRLLKQKEDFITQLAHDLRSPLTPLVALMPMLRDKQEAPGSIKMADMAIRNIDYMEELVNQTVRLAKLNSTDAAEFDIQPLNLASVVKELLHTQQYNFTENNITTNNNIDEEITVAADKLRLTEMFINLATNAIKFTPGGGVLIFDAELDSEFATVSVKDSGIGISGEQADHIFDEFYKADQSRHDLGSAGLGLSICKRITEKHSGRIWVESEGLGTGTTFLFTIPLSTEQ